MASRDRWRHRAAALKRAALIGIALGGPMPSAFAGPMVTTPELRQAAVTSCTGDVLRLCPTVLFDEQKIFACMRANRMQLTPNCGAVFDQGAKTVRH